MIDSQGVTMGGAAVAGSDVAAQVGSKPLGKDDFLKLLVTQLRNQDPLNPLDQNQFLSQTAQFTALEQLQNINQTLTDLKATSASSGMAQAATLLGKTVKVAGRDFLFDGAVPVLLPFNLEGSAGQVQIQVLDQQGSLLRTLNGGAGQPGDYQAIWDGRDSAGRTLTPGTYYYRVAVLAGTGAPDAAASAAQGLLSGFEVRGGALLYRLGGALVRPEDVMDVQQ
jgi:flagellar basal-body rod modification protein FlgD